MAETFAEIFASFQSAENPLFSFVSESFFIVLSVRRNLFICYLNDANVHILLFLSLEMLGCFVAKEILCCLKISLL